MVVAPPPTPQSRGAREDKEPHHGLSEIPHPDPSEACPQLHQRPPVHGAAHGDGQGGSALNSLRRGRYAKSFRETRSKAGPDADFFDWISDHVRECFQPVTLPERTQAQRLGHRVWWLAGRERLPPGDGTKPRYSLKSVDSSVMSPSRIPIRDRRTGRLGRHASCLAGRWMRPAELETKPICYLESPDTRAGLPMRISPDSEFDGAKLVHANSYRQIKLRKSSFAEVGSVGDNLS